MAAGYSVRRGEGRRVRVFYEVTKIGEYIPRDSVDADDREGGDCIANHTAGEENGNG
jgi:hypothetical protein